MLELLFSPKAIQDLEEIFEYSFHTWSYAQAIKYQDQLYQGVLELCKNPDLGKQYSFKAGDYRYKKVNRHLIFYRTNIEQCIVIRILHEVMEVNIHLT